MILKRAVLTRIFKLIEYLYIRSDAICSREKEYSIPVLRLTIFRIIIRK